MSEKGIGRGGGMLRVFTAEVRVSLFYEYMIDTRIDAAE